MRNYFITGTDTGAGKTWVTLGVMRRFRDEGFRVIGMKPVASGATMTREGLRNEDALAIQAECTAETAYGEINPFCFEPPISPNFAAQQAGCEVKMEDIAACYKALQQKADVVVVEGIGGWRVPLGRDLQAADLVRELDLEVVLVVGLRLGCINHALLTMEAIVADGVAFAGWVANRVDADCPHPEEICAFLDGMMPVPLLGVIPHFQERCVGDVAGNLQFGNILRQSC